MTCVLNVVDVVVTLAFVRAGVAEEANPIMAAVLSLGPAPFAGIKIALVSACALFLWRHAELQIAKLGAVVVSSAYAMLAVYDVGWIRILAG